MRRKEQVRKQRKNRLLNIAASFLLVIFSINLCRLTLDMVHLTRHLVQLGKERAKVEVLRETLEGDLAEARSLHGAEHLARRQLGLARPGEVPVQFATGSTAMVSRYPAPIATQSIASPSHLVVAAFKPLPTPRPTATPAPAKAVMGARLVMPADGKPNEWD